MAKSTPLKRQSEEWDECVDVNFFPNFMELPREIRDAIYHLAMESLPTRYKVLAKNAYRT
jgi:hypothetical protein